MLYFLNSKTHAFPRCAVPEVSMRPTGAAGQTAAATRAREALSRPPHEMSAGRDRESAGKMTVMQKSSGSQGTDLARIKPMSAFEEKATIPYLLASHSQVLMGPEKDAGSRWSSVTFASPRDVQPPADAFWHHRGTRHHRIRAAGVGFG